MFELTHFFTGYLVGRWAVRNSKKESFSHQSVIALFAGFAGLMPDVMEFQIGTLGHGTWMHTIIFASLMAIGFASIWYLIGTGYLKREGYSVKKIIMIAWLGVMSHLLLDICTHQQFECAQAVAEYKHLYLWPFWDQSFHLDCLFGWSYLARSLIEWAIYLPILLIVLAWRWKKHGEMPFAMFIPSNWIGSIPKITEAVENNTILSRMRWQVQILGWLLIGLFVLFFIRFYLI